MLINRKLLPIKAHFFFFMAAMGPILPQLPVLGKSLGISSIVMGTITGILPFLFLLTKPAFGLVVDIYRNWRKSIFVLLILITVISYALMYLLPQRSILKTNFNGTSIDICQDVETEFIECNQQRIRALCTSDCWKESHIFLISANFTHNATICTLTGAVLSKNTCNITCNEDVFNNECLYKSFTFWGFVVLISIGTIGFNVINSISDAICYDVIAEDFDYGQQRVWGTIGFGLTALIAGFLVDDYSTSLPAYITMLLCAVFDLIACYKLKLPIIEAPENIFKDLSALLVNCRIVTFITFTLFAGILDSFVIYYLFWYLEDLAAATNTTNLKLIEGLIVAAETLGGEVIFFSISGAILRKAGHVTAFSICFANYALRYGLISLAPSPWWILPIELFMQGPTYALSYTIITTYANEIAPPGTSATMQGIAAGMGDGAGYAIGSFLGGFLLNYFGGVVTLQIFSGTALICSIAHYLIHRYLLVDTRSKYELIP